MRFTSLIVELIRARPRLVFWIAVLSQALLWLMVPLLLYRGPPGDLATVLAYGREYQVGTEFGPPLAYWLADIAFRAAGNHIFGVYLLAQICAVLMFRAVYQLGRHIVGGPQAVIAVLLTMTVTAFSSPGIEFGPLVLARPLWAMFLLHAWLAIEQGRRSAWFALSIEAGLLLLTTPQAMWLLPLPLLFGLATARGRRYLASLDPFFALIVIAVLALPYAVWVIRSGVSVLPPPPVMTELAGKAGQWGILQAWLIAATAGVFVLTAMNWRRLVPDGEDAPVIFRPPVDATARAYVYFFALVPALLGSLFAALYDRNTVVGGSGIALVMSGLAVVIAAGNLIALRRQRVLRKVWATAIALPALAVLVNVVVFPWIDGPEDRTALPSREIGKFFGESFERRTGQKLAAVAGDPQLAALIGMSASRPHVLNDAQPQRTPWITPAKFMETGGVVIWRATDTIGTPPADLAQRFPGLVPEVPRAFDRLINGSRPLLRVGWAIVRPK
ncbi:glycosyltransferase family 39 protein [Rhodopseudomonas boonkerdii]|uniref:glycosyltransferase family 39 protein n=1 Tax=Rhodopseudomonas boonkerdii TaxID=475937 RepID=UPI001E3CB8FC|nr:glycosyltransferase family 39 protein [Rhodopseudomonas boonkerdii]UGV27817.1 glycosyltransferase family 39 protein [Rhodopseudomonas boonkerdii]